MLSAEENKLLTETGPDTLMGHLFRRFWMPALLASELPAPDCPPVRVRLLNEDLVAFRDSEGKLGLVDAHCPHRRADLFFGRNEESGLRCVYHGWKFDVSGACIDMPNEPAESNFKGKITTTAYALREAAGILWAYMGPKEHMPELPQLELTVVPDDHRYVAKYELGGNYLATLEGDIDNSHVAFNHSYLDPNFTPGLSRARNAPNYFANDKAPRFSVQDTNYGVIIGAQRNADDEHYYWHITHWMMPSYSIVGGPRPGDSILCQLRAPVDDQHCLFFRCMWNPTRPLTPQELWEYKYGGVLFADVESGTFRPKARKENNFLIDRALQRSFSFTGLKGANAQDQAVSIGWDPIVDRTKEHLGTSDTAIIAMRRKLMNAARDLQQGIEPNEARHPEAYRIRSRGAVLDRSVTFEETARDVLTAR